MAKCYQCGNGFGFRGKKINKNEIKKERKKLLYSYRKYVETHEILGKNPEIVKEILGFRKQSATFDIFSNKMSDSDLICEKCFIMYLHDNYAREIWMHNLLTLTADQRIQYAKDYPEFSIKHDKQKVEFKEYQKKIHQNKSKVENSDDSEFSYVCYWCKNNFKESDIQSIKYGYGADFSQDVECDKCKDIRKGLYSDKLDSLLTEYSHKKSKAENLRELERKAYRAKLDASNRSEFDDWAGDRTDKITTQNRYDDLVMQSNDTVLALSDIEWNITKEMKRLAEEHFFKNKSNNAEDKDNPKTEKPLEILKVRLAKGEITLEEFKSIKENLDE
jgi:hypothetical protein